MEPLGALEERVMRAVWDHPPGTVREVADRMRGDADRAYTTVMTTLDRLFRKGLLERDKDGQAWRYRARFDRETWERRVADALAAELVAHGEAGLMVTHFEHLVRVDGLALSDAVRRGSVERLVPVLMTALSAGLALLPLVLAGDHPGTRSRPRWGW